METTVNGKIERVAVIGLGRFGVFWARTLSREWPVLGTSRRRVSALPDGVEQVPLKDALALADVVFLTVSISAMPEVLREIVPLLPSGSTVVDTCSVKTVPVQQMLEILPPDVDIIATHPMFGPDSARERSDLLPIIVWPVRDRLQRFAPLNETFVRLGMKTIRMSPGDHDREAALTQGVTHLVGRVLKAMDLTPSEIGTLGYTRLLQVMEQTCNDPVQLFQDLQRCNPYTRQMRQRFSEALKQTEQLLE